MKILHVYANCLGGTQRYVESLLKCFDRNKKLDNFVLLRDIKSINSKSKPKIIEVTPVLYQLINYNLPFKSFNDPFLNLFESKIEQLYLNLLNKIEPDIVHIHHMYGLPINLLNISKRFNIKTVFTIHDTSLICFNNGFIDRNYDICLHNYGGLNCKKCLPEIENNSLITRNQYITDTLNSQVDILTTVSKATATLFKSHGVTKKIKTIYSGVDLSGARSNNENKLNNITFGFVGGADINKGLITLVKAFNRIKNSKANLLIYGSVPEVVKKNIQSFYSGSIEIFFKGAYEYEDTEKIFKQFDVFIFPSICFETTGLVLLEAKYFGIPSIYSSVGGVNEYVKDGVDGEMFNVGNDKQLSHLVKEFIDNPDLIYKLKQKIQPPIVMKETSLHYLKIYKKLFNKQSGRLKLDNYNKLSIYSKTEKDILKYNLDNNILFQLDRIQAKIMNKNIAIFGTGKLGNIVSKNISNAKILCFFDNNVSLHGSDFHKIGIKRPEKIESISYIIISSKWYQEIKEQLLSLGYKDEQLITIHY